MSRTEQLISIEKTLEFKIKVWNLSSSLVGKYELKGVICRVNSVSEKYLKILLFRYCLLIWMKNTRLFVPSWLFLLIVLDELSIDTNKNIFPHILHR